VEEMDISKSESSYEKLVNVDYEQQEKEEVPVMDL